MLIFKGGYPTYGQSLGILVFKGSCPRIPGDAGNALTFDFPVIYEIVGGNFSDLIEGSENIKQRLINSAQKLQKKGVSAIIGDCGLMSLYQRNIAENLTVPFISSSLILLPLIWKIQGEKGKIGIITGHSEYLKPHHLEACGAQDLPVVIQGMEDKEEFRKVVLEGKEYINVELMKEDVIKAVDDLMKKSTEIRSILLECSNLCSFSIDIRRHTHLPVYDLIAAVELLKYSIYPPDYENKFKKFSLI